MLNKSTIFFIVSLLLIPFSLLVRFLYQLGALYFTSMFLSSVTAYPQLIFEHVVMLSFPMTLLSTILCAKQILKSCEDITEALHG
jgi:hypothetical protein